MTTEPKKFTTGWLVGTLLFGAACGAFIHYFASREEPCPECPDPPKETWLSCFDARTLEDMLAGADVWGVRFYLARGEEGRPAVLAGPIKEDGRHVPDGSGTLRFHLFKALSGEGTETTVLGEPEAERAVKVDGPAGREPWSLDVQAGILRGLLATGGANAIGLADRRTTERGESFQLTPVTVASGAATAAGGMDQVLIGSYPCPMHCPKEPSFYLHLR